jgi:hypothetical protein
MDRRRLAFAAVPMLCSAVCVVLSGFQELAWLGLALTLGGAIDFLFQDSTWEGQIASEVYGDAGEEAWQFRSFILMALGPFVALYPVVLG